MSVDITHLDDGYIRANIVPEKGTQYYLFINEYNSYMLIEVCNRITLGWNIQTLVCEQLYISLKDLHMMPGCTLREISEPTRIILPLEGVEEDI